MGICGGRCGGGLERVSGYRDEEREKKKVWVGVWGRYGGKVRKKKVG